MFRYILTITDRFVPKLINGAYWYFTPDTSFGFSPIVFLFTTHSKLY